MKDAVNGIDNAFREVDVFAVPHPGNQVTRASEEKEMRVSGIKTQCHHYIAKEIKVKLSKPCRSKRKFFAPDDCALLGTLSSGIVATMSFDFRFLTYSC